MSEADVVVVGADPTGLVTALGLARAGFRVLVADTGRDGIASAYCAHDWSVLPGLDRLGVLDDALRAGFASTRWCLRVLRSGERIDLDLRVLDGITPFPLTLHLEQAALCRILEQHLAIESTARIERDVRLVGLAQDDAGVDVILDGGGAPGRIRADWVVGADGIHSAVRRHIGLGFPGYTWPERSVVALIDGDLAELGYAGTTFQVDDRYGAVVQRVDDRRWRYTFAEPLTLPVDRVAERIPEALRAVGDEAEYAVLEWHSARMHQRSAERYRVGRVLLAGEAAHVTNRMVGHSPISAFFDAFRLTEALSAVLGGHADDTVLDVYAADRRRIFHDHAAPLSASRKHLISQISDHDRLETELEYYRRASADPGALRDLLLFNRELEGRSPLDSAGR
ncbi:FAD-dependent monooxygenase [Nocardia sp. NPDC004860]|uniref:FAD-dependent oxidoreductase n=1 Tax=Nocardia sp. NPDC004860 TaxID=3154557 RepID=UPI0033AFA72C